MPGIYLERGISLVLFAQFVRHVLEGGINIAFIKFHWRVHMREGSPIPSYSLADLERGIQIREDSRPRGSAVNSGYDD